MSEQGATYRIRPVANLSTNPRSSWENRSISSQNMSVGPSPCEKTGADGNGKAYEADKSMSSASGSTEGERTENLVCAFILSIGTSGLPETCF